MSSTAFIWNRYFAARPAARQGATLLRTRMAVVENVRCTGRQLTTRVWQRISRAGNRSQAKGGRAGCVPKLAGMPGTELEHNFLDRAGSQERQREGLRRSHGGQRGPQATLSRQGGGTNRDDTKT